MKEQETVFPSDISLPSAINHVTELAKQCDVDLLFVGGAVSDPILQATKISFNPQHHEVIIQGSLPSIRRGDGTIKDLDVITFCPNQTAVKQFMHEVKNIKRTHPTRTFPSVSIEPATYDTWKKVRLISLPQFVSTIEYVQDQPYFRFGSISQRVPVESLSQWTLTLADFGTRYPMFHPFAHFLRYPMRNASGMKQKDRGEKIAGLLSFAAKLEEVEIAAENEWTVKERYRTLFTSWGAFINDLLTTSDPVISIKRDATRWYWNHIGTALAHGRGPMNLTELSDKFTG